MKFYPERLTQLRESLNISKAEAARRLNISAMTYGRYEKASANHLISLYAILRRFFTAMWIFCMEFRMIWIVIILLFHVQNLRIYMLW